MTGHSNASPQLIWLRRLEALRLVLVLGFMVGLMAAIWMAYRLYAGYVARSLQEELLVIGKITAVSLKNAPAPDSRHRLLSGVVEIAGLENAQLADAAGRSLADARPQVKPGSLYSPVLLDRNTLAEALEGTIAYGPAQNIAGFPFRSIYLPVNSDRERSILILSAGEEYASILPDLRWAAVKISVVAAVAIIFYAGLFVAGEYLARRMERLERRRRGLALVGMLAAEVAHRVRNPLAIIQSTAETIRRRHNEHYEDDPLFDYIPEEVERVDRAVEQLLSVGRSSPVNVRPVELAEVLQNALDASGVRKRFPKVTVVSRKLDPAAECRIEADADSLREAFVNLIVNAAEAVGEGGRITVEIECSSGDGRTCTAVVSDNGPGIPRPHLKHIFDPFYTMKPNGTGLGLAIAHNTFEQHGARVEIDSGTEGTTIRVRFDIKREKNGE